MSLKDLSAGDFEYYRSYAMDMVKCHEREFINQIDPKLMRAMYRGKTKYDAYEEKVYGDPSDNKEHITSLVIMFQASNTVLPNLYYQNPSPIVKPARGSDADSAALMTAVLKHYMKLNNAKRQNQEAVMNSWFFGLGWKKLGWRAVFEPRTQEPESAPEPNAFQKSMGAIGSALGMGPIVKPDSNESRETPELADYETLFNDSESPMNVAVDHKADLMNSRAILHTLPRTLHDLENYGDYEEEVLAELFEKMQNKFGSRFDSRKTELTLRELHLKQRNGIWILTYCDEYEKPLRYAKADDKGKDFSFKPLSLTFEPGIRYPVSHMKVASQVQQKTDDLASLYVELVSRSVNLIVVNEKALANGQVPNLEKNLARGLVKTKDRLNPGDLQNFTSSAVNGDLPNLIGLLMQKSAEILGLDEQMIFGKSKNETLGQDELARQGTKVRESGMRDRERDWMIEQAKHEAKLVKQYSNSEMHLQITGKDYADPLTGQTASDKWVSFMTPENPLGVRHYLQGDFEHDYNMDEATRPDKKSIRESLTMLMQLASSPNVMQATLQSQFRFNLAKIATGIAGTLDNVINPDEYIERLDSMQVAAIQAQQVLMQGGMGGGPQQTQKEKPPKSTSENGVSNPSSNQANG